MPNAMETTLPQTGVAGPADLLAGEAADAARPAAQGRRPFRLPRLTTIVWLGASILLLVVTFTLGSLGAPAPFVVATGWVSVALFGVATLVALFRVVQGTVALVRRPAPAETSMGLGTAVVDLLGNLLMAGFGLLVAYLASFGFSRGRQLRRFGRVLLPGLRSSPAWTTSTMAEAGLEGVPAGVAEQWRENGKTEHASVAAFARLTLDLMALGAPPHLVAATNRDALDEIRHTELCFSLARALDGKAVSPGPFPEAQGAATLPRSRTLALAKLAVDSLIDGALHEGVSARIIAKLARRAEAPAIRAALEEIAADEGRHAAHGWAVVEWCLAEGGSPVGRALLGALRAVPQEMSSERPAPAMDGAWERWGIHGRRLESDEYGAALAHLAERVRHRVATPARRAA